MMKIIKKQQNNNMKAIDFFSGAGGLTKGLTLSGIKVLAGLDIEETFRDTYEKNNADSSFICANIKEISPDELVQLIPDLNHNDDDLLFAGCAPCQAFSQQRRSDTKRLDEDALIYFGKLVESFLPGQVLMENVKGIQKTEIFKEFNSLLKRNDYNVWFGLLNARDYGVPQNRKRLVLIALRGKKVSQPPPKYGDSLLPYRTVRQAIGHFTELDVGTEDESIPNHVAAKLSDKNLERLEHTPQDGGNWSSWPEELKLKCHKKTSGYTDIYGRMFWERQAPTITCRCNSLSNGRFGHPEQNRAISLREAAALQSFPDDYIFYGSRLSIAKQIGNAVPVQMAKLIGLHLQNLRNQ